MVSSPSFFVKEVRCVALPEQEWLQGCPHLRVPPVLTEDVRRIDLTPDALEIHCVGGDRLTGQVIRQSVVTLLQQL